MCGILLLLVQFCPFYIFVYSGYSNKIRIKYHRNSHFYIHREHYKGNAMSCVPTLEIYYTCFIIIMNII